MADGEGKTTLIRKDRCPGTSYTDLLDADTREVPDFLREESIEDLGSEPLSTDRYTSAEFMRLEDTKMWPNVWQFAAREEEMPEPGDNVVYENAGRSYVLVRQKDGSVRGFHNVCLHRGRKLRLKSGYAAELKCPFHGFTWNNDGSLKEIPCRWDFDHLTDDKMALPEIRVDRWQGFLMVTENEEIPSFQEWVGPSIKHYERWRLDECYTGAWIGRVIPANWKATAEAFMEAWHSIVTHPQILPFTGDANTRYDIYGDHMNRAITPSAVLSPHLYEEGHDQAYILAKLAAFAGQGSEEASADARARTAGRVKAGDRFSGADEAKDGLDEDDPLLARKATAEANREAFKAMSGHDFSEMSDSEMTDNFTYNIFPNFAPWGGFIPNIVYRWRPWKDPDHCLMEVRILMRNKEGEPTPKAAPMHLIPDDEPFASAGHIIGPALASVFDQDMANLPYVQEGMKASANKELQLGNYQEIRVRHFHRTLDKYLNA
ncbi:MAG: aromatic ring-hydroxylating dioxygenase subunit alpha [Pseudomonadota bacterium]